MSESRKKRMSMLDNIAAGSDASKGAPPPPSQLSGNRALRAARTAVDGHNVWDLDPDTIEDRRIRDRMEPGDLDELRNAIEANGQTVPILVRRHPDDAARYLLVYGRRRLEAIRTSEKVATIRAIIASVDEHDATRAQISENMARRDLTYIERAMFADELVAKGFGTQSHVAEILTVTKSSVSMALRLVETIGRDLADAIGPAPGIGRPRWEALAEALEASDTDRDALIEVCGRTHAAAETAALNGTPFDKEASVLAFEKVVQAVTPRRRRKPAEGGAAALRPQCIALENGTEVTLRRSKKGLHLDIPEGELAEWLTRDPSAVLNELHALSKKRAED